MTELRALRIARTVTFLALAGFCVALVVRAL